MQTFGDAMLDMTSITMELLTRWLLQGGWMRNIQTLQYTGTFSAGAGYLS
jgi:hypothetical protein